MAKSWSVGHQRVLDILRSKEWSSRAEIEATGNAREAMRRKRELHSEFGYRIDKRKIAGSMYDWEYKLVE